MRKNLQDLRNALAAHTHYCCGIEGDRDGPMAICNFEDEFGSQSNRRNRIDSIIKIYETRKAYIKKRVFYSSKIDR